ncbi:MAG: CHASE domain-containing protein [Pseudomonadota bacterium]
MKNNKAITLEKTYHSVKEKRAFLTWACLLALSIITGLLIVEWSENRRFLENQRRSIIEKLSTIRARLEGELNSELLLTRSIITEVATNTDISEDRFFQIANCFMKESNHIRNIGLAKGTILTYVFPKKGNEKAIGLDYQKVASQWPAVQRAIDGGKTVVAGPLHLVQGGLGIVGRTPIYKDAGIHDSGQGKYFGILSVVINIPSLFKSAGLDDQDSTLKLSIRGKDGLGAKGDLFYGPEELFAGDPILMPIKLPGGGSWLMAAAPANGWDSKSSRIIYYRIFAAAVGLIILLLLFVQQREMNYRKKLIQELQQALSEVKQLSGLLPICSNCKKIRDDHGYWNQIETYIHKHSEAKFSHSICPDCAKKIYPDLKLNKLK